MHRIWVAGLKCLYMCERRGVLLNITRILSGRSGLLLLLLLAFAVAAARNSLTVRREQEVDRAESVRREQVRRFWGVYRSAGQARAAGDLTIAIARYEEACALKPKHEDALYYLGNCYVEMRRYPLAIATYRRLLAANPLGSSRGYMQLGLIYACLDPRAPRDLAQAEGFFRQALEVDPDSGALLGIGEVALLRGEWQAAREALLRANADNAMSVAAPYLLGYLCQRAGERDEAGRWFHLAVRRAELKKPAVKYTEEGDVKADPELRWRALARQSVFGSYWIRLRRYVHATKLTPAAMEREYRALHEALARARRQGQRGQA